jgi:hypothetical protein
VGVLGAVAQLATSDLEVISSELAERSAVGRSCSIAIYSPGRAGPAHQLLEKSMRAPAIRLLDTKASNTSAS